MWDVISAFWLQHAPVLSVLLPVFTAVGLLLIGDSASSGGTGADGRQRWGARLSMASVLLGLFMAVHLVRHASGGELLVYQLGEWPAPFGIVLVLDRLSALMVLLTYLVAVPVLWYATGGWDTRGRHFHALFQFQLMGLCGAFLTGDLFNLFVFFEVLLIASYGLMLSGGHRLRVLAGMHYVVFNIMASTLFLIALGLLYGMTGTLNMAEMALRVSQADPQDVALLRAASGILLVVFCAKAALLPLYLWLPETYSRAPAAVVALFTVMTKVGAYAVLRVYTLVFGLDASAWVWDWLLPAALVTLVMGSLGALAGRTLGGTVSYLVIASAATLFIAFALHTPESVSAGLYYLVHSTFVTAALFLIVDLVRRQRGELGDALRLPAPMGARALLGLLFLFACVSVAGLPPLSGFVGKFILLDAVPPGHVAWVWSVVLVTSLMTLVALSRCGSQVFWRAEPFRSGDVVPSPPRRLEVAACVLLLGYGVVLSLGAGPALRYTQDAAAQILEPAQYVEQVRATPPRSRAPSP